MSLLDLIFPSYCLGCGRILRGRAVLCAPCRVSIKIHPSLFCAECHRPTLTDPPLCHPDVPHTLGAAASYDDPLVESLVQSLKFDFVTDAATPLADILIAYVSHAFPRIDLMRPLVMPIPLHPRRERMRGFNQSALIARRFAGHFGFEYNERMLARRKATLAQSTLGKGARERNIDGAFALTPTADACLRDRTVILIDDVVTSGVTFRAATLALREQGSREHILALAAAKA